MTYCGANDVREKSPIAFYQLTEVQRIAGAQPSRPIIGADVRQMLPAARLFPAEWKVYQVNHWHRWIVVEQFELSRRLRATRPVITGR